MMHKHVAAMLMFAMLPCLGMAADATPKLKPGLWEVTTQSAQLKELPQISPEQAEQLRKLGVDIAKLQSGAIVTHICIAKGASDAQMFPQIDQAQSGCRVGDAQRTGDTYVADIVCENRSMKGNGTVKATYASDESFTTALEFTGYSNGQPIVRDRSDASGKWKGADCGSIKPIKPPSERK